MEYRDILGHEGYRIGNDGSVWSCLRKIGNGNGGGVTYQARGIWVRLPPTANRSGHQWVRLRKSRRYIHQLVLEAFVGPRPEGAVVRHFPDPDPANNNLCNLSWGTHKENHADRKRHGCDNSGERNGQAKLSNEMVRRIKSLLTTGVDVGEIAASMGLSRHYVRKIHRGERWANVEL